MKNTLMISVHLFRYFNKLLKTLIGNILVYVCIMTCIPIIVCIQSTPNRRNTFYTFNACFLSCNLVTHIHFSHDSSLEVTLKSGDMVHRWWWILKKRRPWNWFIIWGKVWKWWKLCCYFKWIHRHMWLTTWKHWPVRMATRLLLL